MHLREVYGGFGDFNLKAGDRILVYGAGPVGLSFVKFGRLLGLGWIGVVDPLPDKRERALKLGADAVFGKEDLPRVEQEMGRTFDAVIDAVGNETIINAGLPLVKMGGSICVYGVIAAPSLPVNKALVRTISISWSTNGRRAGANARPRRRSAGGFAKGSSRRRNS